MKGELLKEYGELLKEEGKKEGKMEGKIEGELKGELKGVKEGVKEVAKNLLTENYSINEIIKLTGLNKEEIQKLK